MRGVVTTDDPSLSSSPSSTGRLLMLYLSCCCRSSCCSGCRSRGYDSGSCRGSSMNLSLRLVLIPNAPRQVGVGGAWGPPRGPTHRGEHGRVGEHATSIKCSGRGHLIGRGAPQVGVRVLWEGVRMVGRGTCCGLVRRHVGALCGWVGVCGRYVEREERRGQRQGGKRGEGKEGKERGKGGGEEEKERKEGIQLAIRSCL